MNGKAKAFRCVPGNCSGRPLPLEFSMAAREPEECGGVQTRSGHRALVCNSTMTCTPINLIPAPSRVQFTHYCGQLGKLQGRKRQAGAPLAMSTRKVWTLSCKTINGDVKEATCNISWEPIRNVGLLQRLRRRKGNWFPQTPFGRVRIERNAVPG